MGAENYWRGRWWLCSVCVQMGEGLVDRGHLLRMTTLNDNGVRVLKQLNILPLFVGLAAKHSYSPTKIKAQTPSNLQFRVSSRVDQDSNLDRKILFSFPRFLIG
ncbi:hypothetical protein L6452_18594 [Arctium lappa]|uniref:Uncharacterized protein n=1 Tax=Arctium lappa TaxID=4217 RepID=A0ACB9C6N5_ARCLA|nr:hypothetical protein L6452_18594 [Arctium lappa]